MPSKLLLPALKAKMGDWIYYITFMRMLDIAERVKIATEIHKSKTMQELIQRQLETRVSQIKEYLFNQPQRFFNTLVIGIYGGNPEWFELDVQSNELMEEEIPLSIEGALGFLALQGDETLFAIDGQHRVVGIRDAIEEQKKNNNDSQPLFEDEVSTIFVGHHNTPEGLERTRRLFTTLNRYAKPVSQKDIIALDEDDIVAITTRHLVDEYSLFKDKVSITKGKNIPTDDTKNFTSIEALYDVLDIFFRFTPPAKWKKFKTKRPSDEEISTYYLRAVQFWDLVVNRDPVLKKMSTKTSRTRVASKYRNEQGGHLLFRPVGLTLFMRTIKQLMVSLKEPPEIIIDLVYKVPLDIGSEPWKGLIWDPINKRMITAPENQKVALKLFLYSLNFDLKLIKSSPEKLKLELAGLLKTDVNKIDLPRFI